MTDCETCGKPLGPGDGLGCARCMGTSRYVATIEQRRELVQKANRESQSRKTPVTCDERNLLHDGNRQNANEHCRVLTDAGTTQRNHGEDKA